MQLDLASAAILAGVIVGLVTLANSIVFGTAKQRVVGIVVVIISFVAVMLVAQSDFGHTQVVLSKPLDTMNFYSQLVVVVMLAGGASVLWEGFKRVSDIGTPVAKTIIAADDHAALTSALTKPGETTPAGNVVAK